MTGKKTLGYDCVVIPGAAKAATPFTNLVNQAFCGAYGLAAAATQASISNTICSK
jgi:hypothetical protein